LKRHRSIDRVNKPLETMKTCKLKTFSFAAALAITTTTTALAALPSFSPSCGDRVDR